MWVIYWGLLLRLPWRPWVHPGEGQVWRRCSCLGRRGSGSTRYSGCWRLGQQELWCSRRAWQPVLASTLQCSCLESPPDRKPGRPQGRKELDTTEATLCAETQSFFFFPSGSSVPVRAECEGGTAAWLAGTQVAPGVQGHKLPPPQEVWPHQSLSSRLL